MNFDKTNQNIVVVANRFNPSIFTQYWLIKNGLLREKAFNKGCIFTDEVVVVSSDELTIQVTPPQLSITSARAAENLVAATDFAKRVIEILSETPMHGMGVNFEFNVQSGDQTGRICRDLFFNQSNFFKNFEDENCRFGSYCSKDFLGCRLKLNVKPIRALNREPDVNAEFLQFHFNFHMDVDPSSESKHELLMSHLDSAEHYSTESERIMNSLELHKDE